MNECMASCYRLYIATPYINNLVRDLISKFLHAWYYYCKNLCSKCLKTLSWFLIDLEMAVVVLNKQAIGCRLPNDWLLLLSIDLATFCSIWSTRRLHLSQLGSLTSSHVFSLPLPWLPTTPTIHPYVSTCDIDEKLSKLVGNSASYSLKSLRTWISWITV